MLQRYITILPVTYSTSNMNQINRYILFLFSFLLYTLNIQSQNAIVDSLKNELQIHTQKDSVRVNLLNDIAFKYYRKDIGKMIAYIDESEAISKALNYKRGIARCMYLRGVAHIYRSNFDEAITYFEKSVQLHTAINKRKSVSDSYMSMGAVYYYQSDYEKALIFYKKSEKVAEEVGLTPTNQKFNIAGIKAKIGKYEEAIAEYKEVLEIYMKNDDDSRIANCLNSMAIVYAEQGNLPLSLEYHNKSLSHAEKANDSFAISRSLHNIGHNYRNRQNYDKALDYYFKALSVFKREKNKDRIAEAKNSIALIYKAKGELKRAIKYLNESIEIAREIGDEEQVSRCLVNLGNIHFTSQDYNLAMDNYENAKNINNQIGNKLGLCSAYIGFARVFFEKNQLKESLNYVIKADKISKELDLLTEQRSVQQLFSKIYKNTGNYKKALESHQQYKILNDSLFNKENIEKIAQLEYEYKYKQALDSASIRELKLTKTVLTTSQDLERSKQNYLWAVIGILLVSFLLGGAFFFQKYQNIKAKNQTIVTEQKLLRSQMTPHFIFNSLSVLQGMILNKEEKKSVSYLSKFSKLLRITLENSRDKMVLLSQELTAIENYLALQNLENESYSYSILVADSIDTETFKVPPMLIQPFVENAIEHAFANQQEEKKIDISLTYSDKELQCAITDNGIGIDATGQNKGEGKRSLSTTITSERLDLLSKDYEVKGSVTIEDRKKYNEQGTRVTLIMPYIKEVA